MIDHMGYMREADGLTADDADQPHRSPTHYGNCWIKLSGPYHVDHENWLDVRFTAHSDRRLVGVRGQIDDSAGAQIGLHLPDGQRDTGGAS